jgi:DNA-binding NarL/FixJ family response regulator
MEEAERRPRVLLADDHTLVAEGLRRLLEPEFELLGVVSDGRSLLQAAQELDPDVIVADITMPELSGIEVTRQLREVGSRAKVVILTMHQDRAYVARALAAGAWGFVLKHSAPSELITAIHESLAGRKHVTSRIAEDLAQLREGRVEPEPAVGAGLTDRQQEVLQLLAEGRSFREVADALNISPKTAEYHKYRIMKKLDLQNTAQLVRYAVKQGIVSQ